MFRIHDLVQNNIDSATDIYDTTFHDQRLKHGYVDLSDSTVRFPKL